MEYVYTSLLLNALNQKISEQNIKNIITAIGGTPDEDQIKTLIQILEDLDIDEILSRAHIVYMQGIEQPKEIPEKPEIISEPQNEDNSLGLDVLFGTLEEKKSDEHGSLT